MKKKSRIPLQEDINPNLEGRMEQAMISNPKIIFRKKY